MVTTIQTKTDTNAGKSAQGLRNRANQHLSSRYSIYTESLRFVGDTDI